MNIDQNSDTFQSIWEFDEIISALYILISKLNENDDSSETRYTNIDIPPYFSSDMNALYSVCLLFKQVNEKFKMNQFRKHSDPNITWRNFRGEVETLIDKFIKICIDRKFNYSVMHLISYSVSPIDCIERYFVSDGSLKNFINSVVKPLLKQGAEEESKAKNNTSNVLHSNRVSPMKKVSKISLDPPKDQKNEVMFLFIDQLVTFSIEKYHKFRSSFKAVVGLTKYVKDTKHFIENLYQADSILEDVTKKILSLTKVIIITYIVNCSPAMITPNTNLCQNFP